MKVSVTINVDTRDGFEQPQSEANGLFSGCKSKDFLIEGVKNKIKFFDGFDKEIIVFVDVHQQVPIDVLQELQGIADTVVLRKHTNEPLFNDYNYLRTLQMASGDIICHTDQDTAAFVPNKNGVDLLIKYLDDYKYVSYPSYWHPAPVDDSTFNYRWVSTRFFMCKKETLDFEEIKRCFDYDYYRTKYNPSRVCGWMEHWLGNIAGSSVMYPPLQKDYLIFCWNNYKVGVLEQLNNMTFDEVVNFVNSNGGLHYPCDLTLK